MVAQQDSFPFQQKWIQNEGGWCYGMSGYLIQLIKDCPQPENDPTQAFAVCQKVCESMALDVTGDVTGVRQTIRRLQNQFSGFFGTPAGSYEYSFGTPTILLLGLRVSETPVGAAAAAGSAIQGRFEMSEANHAGLCAWDGGGQLFVFDPNAGGALFNIGGTAMPAAIDEALKFMYLYEDRQYGARHAKVKWARYITGADIDHLS